jgi:hypothetical protein
MSELRLQLPETLYQQLAYLAKEEGVSLNQYAVYVLTQQVQPNYSNVQPAYSVRQISEAEVTTQELSFITLRQRLEPAPPEEIDAILAQREQVEPEAELNLEAVERLRQRIQARSDLKRKS